MAARKKKGAGFGKATKGRKPARKKKPLELIISKSRTKRAVECKVSADFYGALDEYVRVALAAAEVRCGANRRSTLRPSDL